MTEINRFELPDIQRDVATVGLRIIDTRIHASVLMIDSKGNKDTITTRYDGEKTTFCAGVLSVFSALSIASSDDYEGFAIESYYPKNLAPEQVVRRYRDRLTRAIIHINDFADLGIMRKTTRATVFVPTKEFVVLHPVAK